MMRYVIAGIVLAAAAGLFLYAQTVHAPVDTSSIASENPFGEGAGEVGAIEEPDTEPTPGGNASITKAELAEHDSPDDCWIGYKGVVYDITDWLPRHPGSASAISPYCGTAEEFATAFNKQHGTTKDTRLQKEGIREGTLE